jgi:DNA-binding Lrp family transcriptional regulator
MPTDKQAMIAPVRRLLFIGTGGVLHDLDRAIELRDKSLPPTALEGQTTIVLDLGGMTLTPGPLQELILTLGRRMKGGVYGATKLILATPDVALAKMIELLAGAYELPLYIAASSDEKDIQTARPVGQLTTTDRETLAELMALGGRATVASLAERIGIEPTAVNNRLANLDRKGYLYRYPRPRRTGDVYVDPRLIPEDRLVSPSTEALRAHGISTDPYDRSPIRLHGDAAKRAAELVEKRTERKR